MSDKCIDYPYMHPGDDMTDSSLQSRITNHDTGMYEVVMDDGSLATIQVTDCFIEAIHGNQTNVNLRIESCLINCCEVGKPLDLGVVYFMETHQRSGVTCQSKSNVASIRCVG